MIVSERTYTIDEFTAYLQEKPDALLELINGRIVETVVGRKHGKIVLKIGSRLVRWAESNDIAGHYGTEVHHRIPDDNHNTLQPDVSFSYSDAPATDDTVIGMPDFVVEVKSGSNTYDELREKARYYLTHGTRLVWLVYPARQIVEVYAADDENEANELYTVEHTLSGGDVLPAFEMTVADIFDV